MKSFVTAEAPLIKFQCLKYIKPFQKGVMYFNQLSRFHRMEKDDENTVSGDSLEAHLALPHAIYEPVDKTEPLQLIHNSSIDTIHSRDYAFCMLDLGQEIQGFTEKQKEELSQFGDYALVIIDRTEFFRRVESAAEKEGFILRHQPIQYYDLTNIDQSTQQALSTVSFGLWYTAFWKRDRYAYQREYRFVIEWKKNPEKFIELEIGSIEDISILLTSKEALSIQITKTKMKG